MAAKADTLDQLFARLNISGLQNRDTPLYEVIAALIRRVKELAKESSSSHSGGGSVINSTIQQYFLSDSGGSDGEIGPPGNRGIDGTPGSAGATGATGPPSFSFYFDDGPQGDDGFPIPGPQGLSSASGLIVTSIEVNLGATALWSGKFTITDGLISATSTLLVWQAPGPYTGKGTLADEAQIQPVSIIAVNPLLGSATVYWETPPMITQVNRPISQFLTSNATVINSPKDPQGFANTITTRIGKVRGNVKFFYTLL